MSLGKIHRQHTEVSKSQVKTSDEKISDNLAKSASKIQSHVSNKDSLGKIATTKKENIQGPISSEEEDRKEYINKLKSQLSIAYKGRTFSAEELEQIEDAIPEIGQDVKMKLGEKDQKLKFIFTRTLNNEVMLTILGKKLGKGTFGKVKAINTYDSQGITERAIKLAIKKYPLASISEIQENRETAIKDVTKEYKTLISIHSELNKLGRDGTGIQSEPYHFFEYKSPSGEVEKGYIGVKYDGDVKSLIDNKIPLTDKEICSITTQLMTGLESFSALGLHHGDIKPGNMFFRKLDDGSYEVCLADYGGVDKIDEKSKKCTFGTFTAMYTCPNDNEALEDSDIYKIQEEFIYAELDYTEATTEIEEAEKELSKLSQESDQIIASDDDEAIEEFLKKEDTQKLRLAQNQKKQKLAKLQMNTASNLVKPIFENSDIYSTALSIYELITGTKLQSANSKIGNFDKQAFKNRGIPDDVTRALERAVDQDRKNRPSATEFLAALKKWNPSA